MQCSVYHTRCSIRAKSSVYGWYVSKLDLLDIQKGATADTSSENSRRDLSNADLSGTDIDHGKSAQEGGDRRRPTRYFYGSTAVWLQVPVLIMGYIVRIYCISQINAEMGELRKE